jgi:hypothetical protein
VKSLKRLLPGSVPASWAANSTLQVLEIAMWWAEYLARVNDWNQTGISIHVKLWGEGSCAAAPDKFLGGLRPRCF